MVRKNLMNIIIFIIFLAAINVSSFTMKRYSVMYSPSQKATALSFTWVIEKDEVSDDPQNRHILQINSLLPASHPDSEDQPLFVHDPTVEVKQSCVFNPDTATVELFYSKEGEQGCSVFVKLTQLVDAAVTTSFSLYHKSTPTLVTHETISYEDLILNEPSNDLKLNRKLRMVFKSANITFHSLKMNSEDIEVISDGEKYDPSQEVEIPRITERVYKLSAVVGLENSDFASDFQDEMMVKYSFSMQTEHYSLKDCTIADSRFSYTMKDGILNFQSTTPVTNNEDIKIECSVISTSWFYTHFNKFDLEYSLGVANSDYFTWVNSVTTSSFARFKISMVEETDKNDQYNTPLVETYPYQYIIDLRSSIPTTFYLYNLADEGQEFVVDPLFNFSSVTKEETVVKQISTSVIIDCTKVNITDSKYDFKFAIRSKQASPPRPIPIAMYAPTAIHVTEDLDGIFQGPKPDHTGFQGVLGIDAKKKLHGVWNINQPYSAYYIEVPKYLEVDFSSLLSIREPTPIQNMFEDTPLGVGVGFDGVLRGKRYVIREISFDEVVKLIDFDFSANFRTKHYLVSIFTVPSTSTFSKIVPDDFHLSQLFPMNKLPKDDSYIAVPLLLTKSNFDPVTVPLNLTLRPVMLQFGSPYMSGSEYKFVTDSTYEYAFHIPSIMTSSLSLHSIPAYELNAEDQVVILDQALITLTVPFQLNTFSVKDHIHQVYLKVDNYLSFVDCNSHDYFTQFKVESYRVVFNLEVPEEISDYSGSINLECTLKRSTWSFSYESITVPISLSITDPLNQVNEIEQIVILRNSQYKFMLVKSDPVADYKTNEGRVDFIVRGETNPDNESLIWPSNKDKQYYLMVKNNFKAAIRSPLVQTTEVTIGNISYFRMGPISFNCETYKFCTITASMLLRMNPRYVDPVYTEAILISVPNYDLAVKNSNVNNVIDYLKTASNSFMMPHYTEAPTTSTLTSTLSWKFDKNVGVKKQIETAKSLVALGAGVPSSSVFLVDLEYVSTASGTIVSAKFAIKSTMEPEDMQNALHQAVQDNKHDLSDLSVNTTKSDVFEECLTEGVTCGGLCAPCTGSESCVNDFDCFSGVCSSQKCQIFDKKQGNSAKALTVTPLTISFYLAVLICSYLFL